MNRTSEKLAHVGSSGFRRFAGVLCCAIAANAFAASGYENDGPGATARGNTMLPKRALASNSGSSFTPPKASDVQFVVTSGGDLGIIHETGETIYIPLNIDRVFGNKSLLIVNGGLPEYVTLRMIVWDVDSDSSWTPQEHDQVFVNGHPVGFLSGHNETWTDNTFSVPTKILNLKANSGDSGANSIQIKVDIDNGGWVTKVDWVSIYIPAAPPVVIAHGIRSNAGSMMMLRTAIQSLGLPVHTFSFSNQGNDGIASGATELAREVSSAKREFGVESVNIVAHSMGGLKSRHYVETLPSDEVMHVFQIATPNEGSPLADWAVAKRDYINEHWWDWTGDFLESDWVDEHFQIRASDPAADELTVSHMARYNSLHRLNNNVRYSVIAGSVDRNSIKAWQIEKYSYDLVAERSGPNDTIVPVSSARALSMQKMATAPGSVNVCGHSALVNDGVSTSLAFGRSELLEKKVLKNSNVSGNKKLQALKTSALFSSASGSKDPGMALQIGKADFGLTTQIKFNILSGNETLGEVRVLNSAKMGLTIKSPSGLLYDTNSEGSEITISTNKANFCFVAPEVGEWTIELTPIELCDESKNACLYILSFVEKNLNINLNAEIEKEYVKVGDRFTISTKPEFEANPVESIVSATVKRPSGGTESIELYDNGKSPDLVAGDGRYTASVLAEESGTHFFTLNIQGTNPVKFSRSSVLSGVAAASSASISGIESSVVDTNSNGYYDELIVKFKVESDRASQYRILATLSDDKGRKIIETTSNTIECRNGENKIAISFGGEAIYQYGETTGYCISTATLIEVGDQYESVASSESNMLIDGNWTFNQFEHAALWIGTGASETPMDNNSDGVYDILNVQIPLVSEGALVGNYQWSCALVDSSGLVMGFATGSVLFPSGGGTTTIAMSFKGSDIALSGNDGPYYVKNFIFWGNNDTFSMSGQFATRTYTIQQWGGTPKSADEPIINAGVTWAYNVSSDSFFAQLNLSCTNGTPSQIGSIRYLFERRTSPEAYLCDKAGRELLQTIKESSENTSFDGRTFYYVDIDVPEIRTAELGTTFKYGVQSEIPENGIVDRVPADERKIGLWIAGRDNLVNKATTEIANDYLGWLSWDANGKTNYIAVGNSAVKINKVLYTAKLSSSKATPPTLCTVNRALALGSSVLMDGSDPCCNISSFSITEDRIEGAVTLTSANGSVTVPGENVSVKLYGSTSLGKEFECISTLTLDKGGRFDIVKPNGYSFFKILIDVVDVVE